MDEDTSNVTSVSNHQVHDKIAYATSLCLATGMWQVILSAMKFGKLSWVMSEIVLSAFVTAAAFHILTSQMKSLFGIIIQRSPKLFGIIYVGYKFKTPQSMFMSIHFQSKRQLNISCRFMISSITLVMLY